MLLNTSLPRTCLVCEDDESMFYPDTIWTLSDGTILNNNPFLGVEGVTNNGWLVILNPMVFIMDGRIVNCQSSAGQFNYTTLLVSNGETL